MVYSRQGNIMLSGNGATMDVLSRGSAVQAPRDRLKRKSWLRHVDIVDHVQLLLFPADQGYCMQFPLNFS